MQALPQIYVRGTSPSVSWDIATICRGGIYDDSLAEAITECNNRPHRSRVSLCAHCGIGGTMRKVTEKWIVLVDEAESTAMTGVPIPNKIPYISRHFKNTGPQTQPREIWIPRDSILYLTIKREPVEVAPDKAKPTASRS